MPDQRHEKEVVLPQDAVMKIDRVETVNGKQVVYVTYLGSQYRD